MSAPNIIVGVSTDQARARMEQLGKASRYHIDEWLVPSSAGDFRVTASTNSDDHTLGFKWDGQDINKLVIRCISLDMAMRRSIDLIHAGKIRPNRDLDVAA